jgi:hypothetical protein
VVQGQIADDADAALVSDTRQRHERFVAAEERVDVVEGRRVVAVDRSRGKDRRQVDQGSAERGDVFDSFDYAGQVAAEPLVLRVPAALR